MTHTAYRPGTLGHLQSLPQRPAENAIAFNVRVATDPQGTEVLADAPEAAIATVYGDRAFRLLLDVFASAPDWHLFVVTLRDSPHLGRDTKFKTIELIVSSGEARP